MELTGEELEKASQQKGAASGVDPEPKEEPKQEGIDYEKIASILDGRQKATEQSVLKGYFKEQGLSGDEVAQAISAFKAQREA